MEYRGENLKLNICKLFFNDLDLPVRYNEKIRGYISSKYSENDILHNHIGNKFIYRYPLVQYKLIAKNPIIIGINEGADFVAKFGIENDKLILDGVKFAISESQIIKTVAEFGWGEDYIDYEFITPWIALNQTNIIKYKNGSNIEKEELLKKILIGNIISMLFSTD
jgi:hypothetical protein